MRSEFDGAEGFFDSEEGSSRNMTRLYGLSDFWHTMFEDSEKIDLLLESNAISASDIYSQFLQLTSSITLEEIQLNTGTQLKLLLLAEDDKVVGTPATYKLPEGFQGSRYITNRPFLATVTYENGPHYQVDIEENTISFYRDPFEERFPVRRNSRGVDEIALWGVDVEVDEGLLYQNYGSLIGEEPQESTEMYRDFLYGLFYLYSHGPDLGMVRRGLNVALGIPLARDDETVLSIRKNAELGQYIVITDLNSYLLPYGLTPAVSEGSTLKVGAEITTWVEVKDYVNDGDWWINLELPKSILPYVPADQVDAYAKPGSYADYLMRNYLRHHTFLVKVNVTSFKNIESFQELGAIIRKVKPTYTTPIYIWSVPIPDEVVTLEETEFSRRLDFHWCEPILPYISKMRRNSNAPLHRGCPAFIRMSLGQHEVEHLGLDPYVNGTPSPMDGGIVDGFVNRAHNIRENTVYEKALLKVKFRRDLRNVPHSRGTMSFTRDVEHAGLDGDFVNPWQEFVPLGMWSIPLYITTLEDLKDRFVSIGVPVPDGGPAFTLMRPYYTEGPINEMGINEAVLVNQFPLMVEYYNQVFTKSFKGWYLGSKIPKFAVEYAFKPDVTSLKEQDYFLCTQIEEDKYAVYWITASMAESAKVYKSVYPHQDPDVLKLTNSEMPMTRGLGLAISSPAYTTRGGLPRGETATASTLGFTDTVNYNAPKNRGSVKIQINSVLGSDMNPSA